MAKRLLRARDYQDPRTPVRMIAEQARPAIRRDLHRSLRHLKDLVPVERIALLLRNGLYWKVKDAVDWDHFREVLKEPFDRIAEAFEEGGRLGARKINGRLRSGGRRVRFVPAWRRKNALAEIYKRPEWLIGEDEPVEKDIGDRFNFDRFDDETRRLLREAQDDLIADLAVSSRDSIDSVIYRGVTAGQGPDEIARSIRAYIGLTDRQASAVTNYARLLSDLDPQALTRQLRNRAMDDAVRDAIDSGTFLPNSVVDKMVEDYADNYLDHRAATIAQTESTRAANAGLHDSYRQAVDRGAIPSAAVRRNWQIALDEKTCPVCRSIPEMNPDGVGVGEDFQSIDGPQDDPPVHPNCRCSVDYVTDLDLIPEDD